jgi:hypothetical protein
MAGIELMTVIAAVENGTEGSARTRAVAPRGPISKNPVGNAIPQSATFDTRMTGVAIHRRHRIPAWSGEITVAVDGDTGLVRAIEAIRIVGAVKVLKTGCYRTGATVIVKVSRDHIVIVDRLTGAGPGGTGCWVTNGT